VYRLEPVHLKQGKQGMPRRLGKQAPRWSPKTLLMHNYLPSDSLQGGPARALPAPRAQRFWSTKMAPLTMMGNDRAGDCVIASAGHMIQCWTANTGPQQIVPTDAQILGVYSDLTGYNPRTGANDNGTGMVDLLDYWRQVGIVGHKILGWMAIEPSNLAMLRVGVDLFGGILAGLALPLLAEAQIEAHQWWTITQRGSEESAPGSLGGHAVAVPDMEQGWFDCITWAQRQWLTDAFALAYLDEAYAVVTTDWINAATHLAPSGFNLAQLEADLSQL
jgi:hypothetical protein